MGIAESEGFDPKRRRELYEPQPASPSRTFPHLTIGEHRGEWNSEGFDRGVGMGRGDREVQYQRRGMQGSQPCTGGRLKLKEAPPERAD